jgi:AMP phosphorylase
MAYKVKFFDIHTPHFSLLMHEKDAADLGLRKADRVKVMSKECSAVAIMDSTETLVTHGEVGIFENLYKHLCLSGDNDMVKIYPASRPKSVEFIKKKMNGEELSTDEINTIIHDITEGNLSDIELSAYVTAVYITGMNMRETEDVTRAMMDSGEKIEFEGQTIFDFHSVGGAPGNKITLIVVPIVAAAGLKCPKTSSRAISSACGTADILETICRVDLSISEIKKQTAEVGGTIAWGGAVNIAPADDIIIKVEYPLSIDPYPQVLASVMAKKAAGGAQYLVMDIPTGAETKVPDIEYARKYAQDFIDLGRRLGITVECAITYGGQPIGNTIGPAIEIKEALECMEGKEVPNSLLSKATNMAGIILEQGRVALPGKGKEKALGIINDGSALKKFQEIVAAQGGDGTITSDKMELGKHTHDVIAERDGYVHRIFNKRIVKIVRAAGAPSEKGAGLYLFGKEGDKMEKGKPLFRIYSDTEAKLNMAKTVAMELPPIEMEGMILERVPSYRTV